MKLTKNNKSNIHTCYLNLTGYRILQYVKWSHYTQHNLACCFIYGNQTANVTHLDTSFILCSVSSAWTLIHFTNVIHKKFIYFLYTVLIFIQSHHILLWTILIYTVWYKCLYQLGYINKLPKTFWQKHWRNFSETSLNLPVELRVHTNKNIPNLWCYPSENSL